MDAMPCMHGCHTKLPNTITTISGQTEAFTDKTKKNCKQLSYYFSEIVFFMSYGVL